MLSRWISPTLAAPMPTRTTRVRMSPASSSRWIFVNIFESFTARMSLVSGVTRHAAATTGPACVTVAGHFDLLDARRVDEEGALDADAGRDASHGDLLIEAAVTYTQDRALELLQAFAVALDDAHRDGNGVTRPDLWDLGLLLLGGKRLQDVVHRHGDSAHEGDESSRTNASPSSGDRGSSHAKRRSATRAAAP